MMMAMLLIEHVFCALIWKFSYAQVLIIKKRNQCAICNLFSSCLSTSHFILTNKIDVFLSKQEGDMGFAYAICALVSLI